MLSPEEAEAILQSLVGQKLARIVRSCDLVGICFRDTSDQSGTKNYGEANLSMVFHLQCPFRISIANEIIAGKEDLFIPRADGCEVDLAEQNTCLFDDIVRDFGIKYDSEYVRVVTMNSFGDVRIELTTLEIRIFVTGSNDCESWRFFLMDENSEHLVNENGSFELVACWIGDT